MRGKRRPGFIDPDSILEDLAKVSKRRNTDPLPLWHHDAMKKGRERKAKIREAAARERAEARQRARWAAKRGARQRITGPMLALMEPGSWYGLKALARAAGLGPSEAGRAKQLFLANAWAERTANPAWDVTEAGVMREREPKWLYRLTPEGEKEKERQSTALALCLLCGGE